MSLFLVLVQGDQQLHQSPETKDSSWQRYQKQLVGQSISKHLQCFTRRPLVRTLGRLY